MAVMFKVHAGDFKGGQLVTPLFGKPYFEMNTGFFGDKYEFKKEDVVSIEVAGSERRKEAAGTAGAALVGGVLLGGFGVLVGALSGGNKNNTIFAIEFTNGKKALIEVKTKDYIKIQSAVF